MRLSQNLKANIEIHKKPSLKYDMNMLWGKTVSFFLKELTKNDAKCSDVKTALKPTTGTNAANNVPNTTCMWIGKLLLRSWTCTRKGYKEGTLIPRTKILNAQSSKITVENAREYGSGNMKEHYTYKWSICNVQPRRIATSYNAEKRMHRYEVDDKGVPTPRANLKKGSIHWYIQIYWQTKKETTSYCTYHVEVCYGI